MWKCVEQLATKTTRTFSSTTLSACLRLLKTLAISKIVLRPSTFQIFFRFVFAPKTIFVRAIGAENVRTDLLLICLYYLACRQPYSQEFLSHPSMFFVLRTTPSDCRFRWLLVIRSRGLYLFRLISPIDSPTTTVAFFFVSFRNTLFRCVLFQELNLRQTLFEATYHFFQTSLFHRVCVDVFFQTH